LFYGYFLMENLWLGMGWQRGATAASLEQAIVQMSIAHHLDWRSIQGVATIDRKAQEPEILEICRFYQWSLQLFTAAELAVVAVPHPRVEISRRVGTPTVAEAAALLAAGQDSQLLVSKQIYRLAGTAVTITVAQAADSIF
jgi:cobalt-precorrin 5A hydrolase/precorrin-3B C17-methyltransferase